MIDWSAIAGNVAETLLGEPSRYAGHELRFGSKGSLSVKLDTGTWYDFENGRGGGMLDLVMLERNCDKAAAMDWLETRGFINGTRRTELRIKRTSKRDRTPDTRPAKTQARTGLVRALWDASQPADPTPGRVYLSRRWAWPPQGLGPDLPSSVRWLSVKSEPGANGDAGWFGLPQGAAGALLFAWRGDPSDAPGAVSLEALNATGTRLSPRWRRTFGSRAGLPFVARDATPGEPVHIAEGEVDALALVLAPWIGPGRVVAAGGTSGIRKAHRFATGPVTLHADGGRGGRTAALVASQTIRSAGYAVRIDWHDIDPAETFARRFTGRTKSSEQSSKEFPAGPVRDAWSDLWRMKGEGG